MTEITVETLTPEQRADYNALPPHKRRAFLWLLGAKKVTENREKKRVSRHYYKSKGRELAYCLPTLLQVGDSIKHRNRYYKVQGTELIGNQVKLTLKREKFRKLVSLVPADVAILKEVRNANP